MIGFAAVQMALMRGAWVIAVAGDTFAGRLRALGAEVTSHGEGMIERVLDIGGGVPDLILDAGPISGVLPDPRQDRGRRRAWYPHCQQSRSRRR